MTTEIFLESHYVKHNTGQSFMSLYKPLHVQRANNQITMSKWTDNSLNPNFMKNKLHSTLCYITARYVIALDDDDDTYVTESE